MKTKISRSTIRMSAIASSLESSMRTSQAKSRSTSSASSSENCSKSRSKNSKTPQNVKNALIKYTIRTFKQEAVMIVISEINNFEESEVLSPGFKTDEVLIKFLI